MNLFWVFVGACSFMTYIVLRLGEFVLVEWSRRGKVRIGWTNGDLTNITFTFHEARGNSVVMRRKDRFMRFFLSGNARLLGGGPVALKAQDGTDIKLNPAYRMGGRYPTFLVDPVTGFNFKPPTHAQLAGDEMTAALMTVDPELAYLVTAENEWATGLRGNEEKQQATWFVPVVVGVVIIVLTFAGVILYALNRISSVAASAGGV